MEGIIENENASRQLHTLAAAIADGDYQSGELDETEGTLTLDMEPWIAGDLSWEEWGGLPESIEGKRVTFDLSDEPGRPVKWWIEEPRCRYDDCVEQRPVATDSEQVTCRTCRNALGLP